MPSLITENCLNSLSQDTTQPFLPCNYCLYRKVQIPKKERLKVKGKLVTQGQRHIAMED